MKRVLFLFSWLMVFAGKSQILKETEVPKKVREVNNKKYPGGKVTQWNKVDENYEARQTFNKKQCVTRYNNSGKIITTETEVKLAELPKTMTDFIVANFKGQSPTNMRKITDEAGAHSYSAEIDHMRYLFDDKGNFLKQLGEGE